MDSADDFAGECADEVSEHVEETEGVEGAAECEESIQVDATCIDDGLQTEQEALIDEEVTPTMERGQVVNGDGDDEGMPEVVEDELQPQPSDPSVEIEHEVEEQIAIVTEHEPVEALAEEQTRTPAENVPVLLVQDDTTPLEFDDEYCETDLELDYSDTDVDQEPLPVYEHACYQAHIVPIRQYADHCQGESYVSLQHLRLSTADCKALAPSIRLSELVSLNLSDCHLTHEGAPHILRALIDVRNLSTLDISFNRIGREGANALHELLSGTSRLVELNIANNGLSDVESQIICEALVDNTSLEKLDASRNKFGEHSGVHFQALLSQNSTLRELNLSWNQIRRDGSYSIALGLKTNTSLVVLDLGWNGFADLGATALGEALRHNSTLTTLDVTSNRIELEGAKHLARVLKENSTILHLQLALNHIGSEGAEAFVEALSGNTTLGELNMAFVPVREAVRRRISEVTQASDNLITCRANLATTQRRLVAVTMDRDQLHESLQQVTQAEERETQATDEMQRLLTSGLKTWAEHTTVFNVHSAKTAATAAQHLHQQLTGTTPMPVIQELEEDQISESHSVLGHLSPKDKSAALDAGLHAMDKASRYLNTRLEALRQQDNLSEETITQTLQEAEEVVQLHGGPGFHAAVLCFVEGAHLHGSYALAIQAAKKAYGQYSGVNAEEEVVQLPPGVDAVAAIQLAIDAAIAGVQLGEMTEEAILEVVAKTLKEFAPRAKPTPVVLQHCVQVAKLSHTWRSEAETYKSTIDVEHGQLLKQIKEQEREVEAALDADLEAGKRPDLTIVVDDGMLSTETDSEVDPWITLEKYMERHSLRLVDLFKRFDSNADGQITREEFVRGVMDTGIDLSTQQVMELMDVADEDMSGGIDYVELSKHRVRTKTKQACEILRNQKALDNVRCSSARGAEILKEVQIENDIIGSTGGGLHVLHKPKA
eukprot:m.25222 g.25222  ORF g.25222 m.25222 type:complete len:944 (-) comp11572_c0_seq2:49-2880(-)